VRDPRFGEIWLVRNEDLGIPLEGLHLVLVLGGSSFKGGPVRIAPGSGSRRPAQDEIALPVDPPDCDPATALTKHTRFRLNEARRIGREKLVRHVATLNEARLKELMILREQGL